MTTLILRYRAYPPGRRKWRRSRGLMFRQFTLEGPPEAFTSLAEMIAAAVSGDVPTSSPLDVDGETATLVIARSREGLELVQLDFGLLVTGDGAQLSELRTAAVALSVGEGELREFEAHDWYGNDEGPVARLAFQVM